MRGNENWYGTYELPTGEFLIPMRGNEILSGSVNNMRTLIPNPHEG